MVEWKNEKCGGKKVKRQKFVSLNEEVRLTSHRIILSPSLQIWKVGENEELDMKIQFPCVDKGSPLSAIGVNVATITTGKLFTALLWKTGYSATSVENALLIYFGGWRSSKENHLTSSTADEWNSSCPYSDRKWKIRSYWCLISGKPLGRTFQSLGLRFSALALVPKTYVAHPELAQADIVAICVLKTC